MKVKDGARECPSTPPAAGINSGEREEEGQRMVKDPRVTAGIHHEAVNLSIRAAYYELSLRCAKTGTNWVYSWSAMAVTRVPREVEKRGEP